jgi:hypothetical protein
MSQHSTRLRVLRYVLIIVAIVCLLVAGAVAYQKVTTTTTTTSTTQPKEMAQLDWTVVSRSQRGVLVDTQSIKIGPTVFTAIRLRARTTRLSWHVGSSDPPTKILPPLDAQSKVDWTTEGQAGVVALFNGAFKQAARAGGASVDGLALEPLVKGNATIVLDRFGHWAIGSWGAAGFPPKGFKPIAIRQNLSLLVSNGHPSPEALHWPIIRWGDFLRHSPAIARTAIGVDAAGNLLYVATMQHTLPVTLSQALVIAGAVTGMELDMNPFWPMMGAPSKPLHGPGPMALRLTGETRTAATYFSGWQRDFFVAVAEPGSFNCSWASPGIAGTKMTPQPLSLTGKHCKAAHHKAKR